MCTVYKILFFTTAIFCVFFSPRFVAAQTTNPFSCSDIAFSLVGSDAIVTGSVYDYTLSVAFLGSSKAIFDTLDTVIVPQDILSTSIIHHELLSAKKVIKRGTGVDFALTFSQLGTYTLRTTVSYNHCRYALEKDIVGYKAIYVYIGTYMDDFNFGIIQNIKQNDILLRTIVITDEMIANPSAFLQMIQQQRSYIKYTKDIFFSLKNYSLIFDVLRLFEKDTSAHLSSKRVFIIDDTNKAIVKKFLARFMRDIDVSSVYVISPKDAITIFLQLSIGKPPYTSDFLVNALLQFTDVTLSYSFGHIVDYLLFQGFPLDMLMLILSCVFAVLFIVFCKQVIGLSSYGVYYPLLFSLALHVIGFKMSLFLLCIAFVTKMIVIIFTRRFTLLATAKLGLQIVLYIFFTIFGLVILKSIGLLTVGFDIFTNPMMLLSYFAILLIASKLWISSLTTITFKQILSILRFLILSGLSYFIIQSSFTHYIVLLYPGVILLAIIILIVLGRYTGLQLIEFVRFWPLIKHLKHKK